ncbi:hypothetical protein CI109_106665 [Kwoniella shandongensis]|uniref:Uncharacterized protein n=1 Tax=Kwoniella shandongensis TaxID=1734106 RepID=A0A5M6BR29_9TREE|nr:uncharacterized protein CI109_006403 [Kwoniella shandongensis]KAA5525233.1 hypothetical protein CI109_006403 [Kwoniella shandongensis]
MVNESTESYRPDHFPNAQWSARDLPRPTFGRSHDVRGGNVKHVRSVAWSCDGKKVATGGEYKELLVWDAKANIESKASTSLPSLSSKPNPHNGHVGAIAWSPADPNILVSGDKGSSAGGTIAIWNLTSPSAPIATFRITGDVLHIAFHPSGRHFAVVCPMRSRDEVYFYWQTIVDGKEVWARREDIGLGGALGDIGSEEINSLRFTNSGKLVCAVSNDGSINAWIYPLSLVQPEEIPQIPNSNANGNTAQALVINESGPSTTPSSPKVTADADADADAEGDGGEEDVPVIGKSRATSPREGTPGEEGGREGKAEGEGGDVEMSEDVDVKSGEGEQGEEKPQVEGEGNTTESGEGETKAEETATIADVRNQDVEMEESAKPNTEPEPEPEATIPPPSSAAPSRRPTPPPPAAVPTPAPRAKQLLRLRHSVCHSASLLALGFDPRGQYLAVGGQDALLSMFDTKDWICERTFDVCTAAIRHIAFSQDGEFIAIGGDDTFIAIVSVYTGATIAKVPVQGMVNSLTWHPRRNWLAYSTAIKTSVPVWHVVHQE